MNKCVTWVGLLACFVVSSVLGDEFGLMAETGLVSQKKLLAADEGRLQAVDLVRRILIINDYEYHVGADMNAVEVKMLGSSAGALELLVEGMYVRVEYRQVRGRRLSMAIQQLQADRRMDH
jgi:hypothetical protein